ncbi:uncharacterized protein LOC120090887 [Benincasa hispida]|uniref:uncharacterized protein LOC120090887 n=1 Tax=Benincasa hispida TaxID=102211 RepID=UPI0019028861|nr:uncharacterized protein LOC120090887 [Benincasa hispida]
MELGSNSLSSLAPPVFDGEIYQAWAIRMQAYMEGYDYWDSVKKIWEFLKSEYEGDERIKGMKVLNLVQEFERMQMKDSEPIKEYLDKLIGISNKARALGTNLSENRLVQKILVSIPERYEATIASLENTKDLSKLKVIEVVSDLQAQEQRRLIRQKGSIEGVLKARLQQG